MLPLVIIGLALSASQVAITSEIGSRGLPLSANDLSAVPEPVIEDATRLATELFGDYQTKYDDFVDCLNEKGAVIYGNDYCSYTTNQLGFFGKSKEGLNYVKCVNNEELCNSKGVSITPTWEIGGKTYSGVQTFEKLSSITGCNI